MALTPDIVAQLEDLGIVNPAASRWHHSRAVTDSRIGFAEHVCNCGDRPKRVTLLPFTHGDTCILIGQCSECHTIDWARWIAPQRQWSGPVKVEAARPLYTAGQGAW